MAGFDHQPASEDWPARGKVVLRVQVHVGVSATTKQTTMLALVLLTSLALATAAAPQSPITNNAEWQSGRPLARPRVTRPRVESAFLYRPETNWAYSHHPSFTFFKDQFFAIGSNSRKDGDAPGQRVLLATSRNALRTANPPGWDSK
jgi:hypothetical protein